MIKSNILKKIASIAVTASLAIGGSLLGAAPAQAAVYAVTYDASMSGTTGVLPTGTGLGTDDSDANGVVTVLASTLGSNTYQFMGWTTVRFGFYQANSQLPIYNAGDQLTITGPTTLYGVWGFKPFSSTMTNSTTLRFGIPYEQTMDGAQAIPLASDFTVQHGQANNPITALSMSNGYITLTLQNPVAYNDSLNMSYVMNSSRRIYTSSGLYMPSYSNFMVSTSNIPVTVTLSNGAATDQGDPTASELSFTSSQNIDYRWVVKLATSAAPASASDVVAGTYGADVVSSASMSWSAQSGRTTTLPVTGLTRSTSYIAYIAGRSGQYNATSNLLQIAFTTPASSSLPSIIENPTIVGTPSTGTTLTISAFTWANSTPSSITYYWYECASGYTASAERDTNVDQARCNFVRSTSTASLTLVSVTNGSTYRVKIVDSNARGITSYISPTSTAAATGGGSQIVNNSGVAPVISGSAAVGSTLTVTAGYSSGGLWMICDSAQSAGMAPASCGPFKANASDARWINGSTLVVPATTYKWTGCALGVCTTTLTNLAGKHIGYYNSSLISATLPVDGQVVVEEEPELPLLDSLGRPARTQGKTPAFVKSVVKDIAASLSAIKPIHASANQPANGGVIKLETESLGTVSKIMIGDTEVKTDLKDGVISFTSPLVKVPTDLTITASIGTLIFDDAIKPIATLKSVLVPVTSGNVNKITDATIEVLNSVLLADSKATNVTCTATASANNGIAKAAARAAAAAACGYLTNVAQDMVAEIIVKVDTAARNNKATKLTFEVSK